jgi:hypothetical protein
MLPLKYLDDGDRYPLPGTDIPPKFLAGQLPDGEKYGFVHTNTLPQPENGETLPQLIPGHNARKKEGWKNYGAFQDIEQSGGTATVLPIKPGDPFGTYGALPGEPRILARRFNFAAYVLEIIGVLLLFIGISLNILFIGLIIYLLS